MKTLILIATALAAVGAFADRTASREWTERNFVSRTNEWKLVERRHALFLLDLNAENGGKWRAFELKASTNNYAKVGGVTSLPLFWSVSDEADGYAEAVEPVELGIVQDTMRLYRLTTRGATDRDGRAWTRIATTLEIGEPNPCRLAVIVSPANCHDGGAWLSEENGEIVWSYTRADGAGPEKDTNGAVLWHPTQPVKWYRDLPEWAK